MKQAIIYCRDCETELNRTDPFPDEDEGRVVISSAFAALSCPKGCRATFKDMNINTRLVIVDAPLVNQPDGGTR